MFGNHFYHRRIRKAVAVFGSLFNDIKVVRTDASGNSLSQQKVPLSYAPRRDFLARIDAMNNGEDAERQIAIKLPRMSFEIISMNYDVARQLPKMNSCITFPTAWEGGGSKLYTPVPYIIGFQLNVFAKSQDDALQIVEQIMPYFTPTYTVTIKPLDDYDVKEDTPITLQAVTFQDDYEAPLESRRSIIYTLDFEMKLFLYKGVASNTSLITKACVDFLNFSSPTDELFSTVCADSAFNVVSPLTYTTTEDTAIVKDFKIDQLPSPATAFSVSDPTYGTATASLVETINNLDGSIGAKGTLTYTPNADYNGADAFDITIAGAWGQRAFPITISVTDVQDAFANTVSTTVDTPVSIEADSTDNFEATTVVYSIAIGGEPSNGSVVIDDASQGDFTYTPNPGFTGTDQFTYRVTPVGGTSEVATVTINVV